LDVRPYWITTLLLFLAVLIMNPAPARAGIQEDPMRTIGKILQAIESSDAEAIVQYTSPYVQVSVLGKSTLISRAQSAYVLKAFFREYPPDGFTLERRLRVGQDWFVRGKYRHRDSDTPFQLELQMRWNGERYEIKNILIDYLDR
jgi:hypothetical protein